MPPNNADSGKVDDVIYTKLSQNQYFSDGKIFEDKKETCEKCKKVRDNKIAHSESQTNMSLAWQASDVPRRNRSVSSLVDELLCDIYSKLEVKRRISATTCDLSWQDSDYSRSSSREVRSFLQWVSRDADSLINEKKRLEKLILEEGNKLVKHLKRKNILIMKREAHYDVITAYIQAISTKTREATKMKFSLTPGLETGFSQWVDAMKMVAQLPGGMPPEFRTKLWLQLSEKHLNDQNVNWEKVEAAIFNEWTNPDDEELGVQIVKDLHRTGCSLFCGEQEQNQALLKRVLLAYARWNKTVGYCQGFNMLAALILQVMDKDEKNAVKVMIYLIEGVLPESYFANNLRGLSVDMAVLRDLLRLRLPKLSKHLDALQHDTNAGTSYEPPLTNVFTMQWFLTLFSNCLPQQTVLRVWDLVFLYGNEVLLRTALAIWGILQDRIITVQSADEFYSIMGVVTREMLEFGLMDANTLVKMIAMVDPFPDELQELREKYLYNISPWTQSVQSAAKKGIRLFYSDPEDQDDTEDEDKIALATAYGVFRRRESSSRELQVAGPTLDISVLKQQYAKLRQRQRQAHVIITAACNSSLPGSFASGPSVSVNHLLMGKSALVNKGRRIGPPEGSIPPPTNKKVEVKDSKRPNTAVSEDIFRRNNASKVQHKNKSNKAGNVIYENEKNKVKNENEENDKMTNDDRVKIPLELLRKRGADNEDNESGSSNSSTSTELCDDEFHRFSDFDSEEASNSDASGYHLRENSPKIIRYSPDSTEYPSSRCSGIESLGNGGCDKDKLKEIKNFASNFVNEIEEEIATSEQLNKPGEGSWCRRSEGESSSEVTLTGFNNSNYLTSVSSDDDKQLFCDNNQKTEPEVPIHRNLVKPCDIEKSERNRKTKSEYLTKEEKTSEKERIRRKSDLGLSVIKENLEMLLKFSHKSLENEGNKSSDVNVTNKVMNETYTTKKITGLSFKDESPGKWLLEKGDTSFLPTEEVEKTVAIEKVSTIFPSRGKHILVEKAISPVMLEKESTAIKVNKEVNTEITFGGEEVEITTTKAKLQMKDETKADTSESFQEENELSNVETFRRTREPFRRDRDKRDEIKQRIEVSKSDWELKMRKIAELETTTRETLNEIQAQSNRRKTFHRSLDRNTKRTYLEDSPVFAKTTLKTPESTKIDFSCLNSLSNEKFDGRKAKISGLSFDAITSRTEKLLAKVETLNRSDKETLGKRDLSPKFEYQKPKNEQSKMSTLEFGNDFSTKSSKIFEFHSSPTSPTHSRKARVKYSEYSSPKRYHFDDRYEDQVCLNVWQEERKNPEDFFTKKYSSQAKVEDLSQKSSHVQEEETSLRFPSNRSNFNPFPTRTLSRPKDLGVKLGLYPSSPSSESQFQKS